MRTATPHRSHASPSKGATSTQAAKLPSTRATAAEVDTVALLADLRSLINAARQRIATTANSTQTLMCWHVGQRLLKDDLQGERGAYGKRILATVSQELMEEFGEGFHYSALTRMVRFAQWIPDEAIVATLSQQLSWSHIQALLPVKDPLARDFYAQMCRIERWNVRTLRAKIGGMLFERTALSKNSRDVISSEIANLRDGRMTPEVVFRDPYFLDFLGLKGAFSERDLEGAILREIEAVLLELGNGFAFVARQKRISVGGACRQVDGSKALWD